MGIKKKDLFKNISTNAKASFKTKQSKHGSLVTVSTSVIILIVLVVNLIFGKLDIKFDLTKDKLYSLSEQTSNILNALQNEITIMSLEESDKKNNAVRDMLSKYESESKNVKVEYVDPVVNPSIVKDYSTNGENITAGSIIVKNKDRFKVISNMDMYDVDYNQGTVKGIKIEQQVTSAIDYVTNNNLPTAFVLQGHNEGTLPTTVSDSLKTENYTVKDLNLLSEGNWEYKSSDVLIINAPQKDLTTEEYDSVMKFFNAGGGALFIMDYVPEGLENFNKLFDNYGIAIKPHIVVEGDNSQVYKMNTNIIPSIESHEITNPIANAKLPILVTASQGIEIKDLKRSSLEVKPLLETTDSAYSKKNQKFETIQKEDGDENGPFNLGVAVSDKLDNEALGSAKLVVITSKQIGDSQLVNLTKGGNLDLIMNSMNWLTERENNISIRSKNIQPEQIMIQQNQFYVLAMFSVIALPLVFAIAGVVVWMKRKHL